MVEGVVHEVQYAVPTLDKRFIEAEMKNPTGYVSFELFDVDCAKRSD